MAEHGQYGRHSRTDFPLREHQPGKVATHEKLAVRLRKPLHFICRHKPDKQVDGCRNLMFDRHGTEPANFRKAGNRWRRVAHKPALMCRKEDLIV